MAEYRMRHLSMRACVYGILSICRYSSSIFPADFPTVGLVRENSREFKFDAATSSPAKTRFPRDARDLSLILNRFSLGHDKNHLPVCDISISDTKNLTGAARRSESAHQQRRKVWRDGRIKIQKCPYYS